MGTVFDDTPRGKYLQYLENHISNVEKAYDWIKENCPDIINSLPIGQELKLDKNISHHDESKYSQVEFIPYMNWFYGENKNKDEFDKAWNYHQKSNLHHWQYWILINDSDDNKYVYIDMPMMYIIEMICDWWAFSWAKNNLYEIFDWYKQHKKDILISDNTRYTVEMILGTIKNTLKEISLNEE